MKQRKFFAKRVLTFMLSLAMVMTSITMPSMTAMAAPDSVSVNDVQTEESTTATPVGLTAAYKNGAIEITWGAGHAEGTTWEAVVTATEGETPYESTHSIDTFAAATLTHSGEGYVAGVTYSVVLYAILDGVKSDATTAVEVVIPEEGAKPALGNPTGLVVGFADNCITAVWGAADGATGYVVTITGVNTDVPYTDVQNVTEAKMYSFACLNDGEYEKGKTYRVTLQATNGEETTEVDAELTKTVDIPAEDLTAIVPATPDGVVAEIWAAEDEHKGDIRVAWANIPGNAGTPTTWNVYISEAGSTTEFTKVAAVAYGQDTVYFIELTDEQGEAIYEPGVYTIAVSAENAAGESDKKTATNTITIEGAPAPAPVEDSYVLVSEQLLQAKVGSPVTLSYQSNVEDFAFTAETTTIKVGETTVADATFNDADFYGRSVTIPASYFTEAGVYEITFAVEGFDIPTVYQTVYAIDTTDDWDLIWSDEFVGTELDDEIWDHQTGIGDAYTDAGWGNNEEQYYTDGDNTTVGGGKLTITARKEATEGFGTKYTSSRLRTVTEDINPETGKANPGTILVEGAGAMAYGKIEAKIKMPTGDGIWPAFWMLPHDSQYGGWAAGGEIDIVEAKGRIPNQIVGTIHHGGAWPNNVNTGLWTTMDEGDTIDQYHIYTIEWDPDEMRWYLDGELYSTVNNWYSKAGEEGNYPYPAPFDEEFYILLNVAVGGTFDNEVSSDEVECDTTGVDMDVDYVRWYQRPAEEYESWVIEYPESEKAGNNDVADETDETVATLLADKTQDGNYVKDPTFTEIDVDSVASGVAASDVKPANRGKWFPLANVNGTGGEAKYTVGSDETNGNYLKVNVSNTGTQTYSTQMLNYVPIVEGYSYELTYKAWTDDVNTKSDITVAVGGDEGQGYSKYSSNYTASLTTTPKTYKHAFTMNAKTDPLARLEINLATSTGTVYLTDVCLKVIEDYDESYGEDDPKEPLANGNHLWNGEFNIGNDAMLYWHWTDGTVTDDASVAYVTKNGTDGEVKLVADDSNVTLYQKGIQLLQNDTYKVTFETDATYATVRFKDAEGNQLGSSSANIAAGAATAEITMPSGTSYEDAIVEIVFENAGATVTADSFKMVRTTNNNVNWDEVGLYPVYNGDFYNGIDGWEPWSQDGASCAAVVNADGALDLTISMPTGAKFYSAGFHALKNLDLTKGYKYIVSFDYTLPATKKYKLEVGEEQRDITLQAGSHTYVSEPFSPAGLSDLQIFFGPEASEAYKLTLDNIKVYIDPASITLPESGYAESVSMRQKGYGTIFEGVTVEFEDDATWEAAEKTYFINAEEVTNTEAISIDTEANLITIDKELVADGGEYLFAVKADGYVKSHAITLKVLTTDNRLTNGDFTEGTNGWTFYRADWEGASAGSFAVEEGVAVVNHGYHSGADWHFQLYQGGVQYDAGHYVVSFDAWSEVDRDIAVLLSGSSGDLVDTKSFASLTDEKQSYKFLLKDLEAAKDMKVMFLLGAVNGSYNNGEDPYNIYIDNVVFRPAYDEDIYTEPVTIKASAGAGRVGEDVAVTYMDENPIWKAADKEVYVNGKAVAADKIKDATDAGFTIDGSVFATPGAYQIYVVADGFNKTNTAIKNVIGPDGNLIFDGDMNDASTWTVWDHESSGNVGKIENGIYKLVYSTSVYEGYWLAWSSQLKKENISVEAGKTYCLSFEATTDMVGGRQAVIEYPGGVQQTVDIPESGIVTTTVTPTETTDAFSVNIMCGAVGDALAQEGTFPHTVTIDNVSLVEGTEAPARVGLEIMPIAPQTYAGGTAIKPTIVVYNGNTLLTEKKDYTVSYKNNKNVGTATVTVTGKGSYKDKETATFEIVAKDITTDGVTYSSELVNTTLDKNGKFKAPKVTIKYGKTTLKEGTTAKPKDYIIAWPEDTTAGYGKAVTITGTGNYKGTKTIYVDILPYGTTLAEKAKVTIPKMSYEDYKAGTRPTVSVKNFVEGTDYTVYWPVDSEDINVGKKNVAYIVGTTPGSAENLEGEDAVSGKLYGMKAVTFELTGTKLNAKNLDIALEYDSVPYDGYAKEPAVNVKDLQRQSEALGEVGVEKEEVTNPYFMQYGVDYTVSYTKNTDAGTAQVIITGKGAYEGSVKKTFKIEKVDLSVSTNEVVVDVDDQVYTGKALKPAVTVEVNGRTLGTKEYSVKYNKNKVAGTANVVVTGKGNYTGKTAEVPFTIATKAIGNEGIMTEEMQIPLFVNATLDKNGKFKAPKVAVKYGKTTLKEGTAEKPKDYIITWPEDLTAGYGKGVTITGTGNYSGTVNIIVDILPYGTTQASKAKVTVPKMSYADYAAGNLSTVTVKDFVAGTDYAIVWPELADVTTGKNNVVLIVGLTTEDEISEGVYGSGKLYGVKEVKFELTGTKLSTSKTAFEITGVDKVYPYANGAEVRPEIAIKDIKANKQLNLMTAEAYNVATDEVKVTCDGIVTYEKNTAAGTGKVVVNGVNGYTGKISVSFKIDKQTMEGAKEIFE